MGPPMSEAARLWISFFILYQEMWQSVDVQMVEVEVQTGGSMEVQTADGFVMYGRWIPSTAPDPPIASTAMVRFCPL